MAIVRQTFPRSGNPPDLPSLVTAVRPTIGDPFSLGVQQDGAVLTVVIEKPTAWQAGEISSVQSAVTAAPATSVDLTAARTSREKDILTTCALIVRRRLGESAWTGLNLQGKKDAVFAEADVWRDMRIWAETNL